MQTFIASNFPHKTALWGRAGIAPCDNWRIARVYAEGLAQRGVPDCPLAERADMASRKK